MPKQVKLTSEKKNLNFSYVNYRFPILATVLFLLQKN